MRVTPAEISDVTRELRRQIFTELNCVAIGEIESFDQPTQSAKIRLAYKRRINGRVIDYPVLLDCPVVLLQGGGAYITFPVKAGDSCLVLFCDRDIDRYWVDGTIAAPDSPRKHSLSDGIALVGLNKRDEGKADDQGRVVIEFAGNGGVIRDDNNSIEMSPAGTTIDGPTLDMLGATESFVRGDTLTTALTALTGTIAGATSGTTGQNAAGIETIKTAFATFSAQIETFKSATIKGE